METTVDNREGDAPLFCVNALMNSPITHIYSRFFETLSPHALYIADATLSQCNTETSDQSHSSLYPTWIMLCNVSDVYLGRLW